MVVVRTLSNVSGQCVRAGKTQTFLDNEVRNALRVHVMDVGPMTIVVVLIVVPMYLLIFEIFVRAIELFQYKVGHFAAQHCNFETPPFCVGWTHGY